jgi:cysteine desulfurase
MKTAIYLDHAATTRLNPTALEAMLPHLEDQYGNPSGQYAIGRQAARVLDDARHTVAAILGCKPAEVVFTGPGSATTS